MAEPNVVEILVKASDGTKPGFEESKASSEAAAGSVEGYAAAVDRAARAEEEFRGAQAEAEDAQAKLDELQRSGAGSADELAAAQDKVTQATLRSLDAQVRLAAADEKVAIAERGAGDAAEVQAAKTEETAGKSGLAAAGLANFGMIGGVALAGVGYEAIKMGMSFQSAMERLVTQAGVAPSKLGPLKSGILDLAGKVGFSPDSLATSMYHVASSMASLGTSGPKMLDAVRTAAEGAKVGGANLEDVTNALTASIASGIPGVQNFGQAMGALNAIVGAGDMSMQQLAEAMGTGVLATVKGYGLSLKDVGAALAVFGDNNIRGSAAAQQLRMAVQALAQPAAAGKKALEGIGLTMGSLGADMRSGGLLKALQDLQEHFKKAGVTAKEQGAEITEIFGKKAGTGLNVLMDQMDRLRSKYPDITKGAEGFGEAWKKTQGTAKQQFDELKSTVDSLMTSIGDKLLPVVETLAGFLLRNKGIIEDLAGPVLAIVGAFTALKLVMAGIQMVSDLSPWTIAIMAIAVAAEELITHWKTVEKVAKEVFKAVEDAIKDAWDWIKSKWPLIFDILIGPIGLAVKFIVDHWKQITDGAKDAYHDVLHWFDTMGHDIRAFFDRLAGDLFNAGKNIIKFLAGGISSAIGDVEHAVGGIVHDITSFLPFSPAKKGPLSGSGSPDRSGASIARMLAEGMQSGRGAVQAAAEQLAGAAGLRPGGQLAYTAPATAAAAGGGDIVIRLGTGGSGLDQMFMTWLKEAVRTGGGDPAMFTRKVKFQ